ncbi:efflux transporter outer membrane subunit [Aestuariirhabdus sp. Z084]|uniref:efflux transporter outer membrane subunit n=1 Tax=Aestuariirhabdus haliotis TaxID=2918751 RepID=UPI00201B3B1B|nr:efflux transporter outer membrane subunit [Aestuariirhabdus haliotis]MCL6417059.1 efflux transporter outer membrane subunit [Aestuariirhabdus haliotis]MCL6420970.1 efflux transporter outer membrane subunit [Aestuariirhabdus haliotis]
MAVRLMAVRLMAVIVCAILLASCAAVGPDYKKPEADVLNQWQAARDASVDSAAAEHRQWWKSFNDPVLDDLVQRAYSQNLSLQVAGLRVYEARALLGIATGLLYPQSQGVNGSASTIKISENADPVTSLPPGVGDLVDTSYKRYGTSLDAAWELDFWGRFRRGVESADAGLAASVADYDEFLVTLTGEVATSYILLRTLEERLNFAEKNVAIQQRSLEITDVRFRNGLVTELDVQLARALLGNTKSTIPPLKSGIRQTRLALSLLLGLPPSDLQSIVGGRGDIPDSPQAIAVGIPADLLRRRPDIRRAEALAAAQSARIGAVEAELYPSFRLIGTVGYAAGSSGDLFDSGSDFNLGAFGFSWKLLNYGRIRNQVRAEDARYQQAALAYQNTVLNAAREVESSLTSFLRSKERVLTLADSVAASRRAVELAQTQYRDGIISYTLVLDAQQFLLLNEDQFTASRGEVARNLIATYKALGGGWQMREGNDLIPETIKTQMKDRTNWGGLLETGNTEPVAEEKRGAWRAPDF